MKALSDTLNPGEKPDPDAMRLWRDNRCTQWFLSTLKQEHQKMLEQLASIMTGNADSDIQALYKYQGALDNTEFQIEFIEGVDDV